MKPKPTATIILPAVSKPIGTVETLAPINAITLDYDTLNWLQKLILRMFF